MEISDVLYMIAIFVLIGVLIGTGVQNYVVSERYNDLVGKYNNLSSSCVPVITVRPGVLDRPAPNFTEIYESIHNEE